MLVFVLFVIVPLVQTVIGSFVGGENLFSNYIQAFSMPRFRMALAHTALYTVLAFVLVLALAFPIAYLIHRVVNRHKRIRYLIAMPYASSFMSLSMIWLMFFNSQNGLVNKLMPLFGLNAQNWLESPVLAFACVFSLVFWRGFCFTLFNCLLSMERLPQELHESAAIAGASVWQEFVHIAMPQMLPTLMYVIPTAVVSVLTTFEPIMLLYYAGMSPDVTGSMVYMFYQQANLNQPGVACAIAVLLLAPIMICCHAYSRYILGRRKAAK